MDKVIYVTEWINPLDDSSGIIVDFKFCVKEYKAK